MGQNSEIFIEERNNSALKFFEKGLRKSEIKTLANNAVERVMEEGNILQVAEVLSAMENFIKDIKDDVRFKTYVREETAKHPKGFNSNSGAKIEMCETGTAYDFSQCNDPELTKLHSFLEATKEQVKGREAFLKTVPSSGIDIRYDDELVTVYPPSKSSTSSYKITLAK